MKLGNTVFVDRGFEAYEDQWRFLSTVKRLSTQQLDGTLAHLGKKVLGDLADAEGMVIAGTSSGAAGKWADSDNTPWVSKRQVRIDAGDMPAEVKVVRSNLLYVSKEGLSSAMLNRVKRLAAFANPDFYRAQAMRQNVYGKQRILHFEEDLGGWLCLPRGCEDALVALFESYGVSVAIDDERCDGRRINVSFSGQLRPEQQPAVDALLKYDLGILVAPTAFGKTVIGANLIAQRKVSTLVLVPRVALLKQWQNRLQEFLSIDEELPELLTPTGRKSKKKRSLVGQIGAGAKLPSGIVDIALVPALFEKGEIEGEKRVNEIVESYGMVICDECHHIPATSFEQVMRAVRARFIYGLTATPKRADGLQSIAFMQCGPIRCRIDGKAVNGQSFARVMVPRFTKTRFDGGDQSDFTQVLERVCSDKERSDLIVSDVVRTAEEGRTSLVLTRRVEHAVLLEIELSRRGCPTMLLVGSDSAKVKREKLHVLDGFSVGKPFVLVATGSYIGEGFDEKRLDTLFLAAPIAWSGLVAQYVGRLHRECDGKREVRVYDYVDINIRMLDRMYRKRLKEYSAQGYVLGESREVGDMRGEFVSSDEYIRRLEQDITASSKRMFIASSEANLRRVHALMPHVLAAAARGVEIEVRLAPAPDDKPGKQAVLLKVVELLDAAGFVVGTDVACPNLVIIDERIVWYGGVAALSFACKEEQTLRFASAEVAGDLARTF